MELSTENNIMEFLLLIGMILGGLLVLAFVLPLLSSLLEPVISLVTAGPEALGCFVVLLLALIVPAFFFVSVQEHRIEDRIAVDREREQEQELAEQRKKQSESEAEQNDDKDESDPSDGPTWIREYLNEDRSPHETELSIKSVPGDRYIVSSERWVTEEEADEDALRIARTLIEAQFTETSGYSPFSRTLDFEDSVTESFIVDEHLEAIPLELSNQDIEVTMHRQHLLLDLGEDKLAKLMPVVREQILHERIFVLSGVLLALLVIGGSINWITNRSRQRAGT